MDELAAELVNHSTLMSQLRTEDYGIRVWIPVSKLSLFNEPEDAFCVPEINILEGFDILGHCHGWFCPLRVDECLSLLLSVGTVPFGKLNFVISIPGRQEDVERVILLH